MIEINEYSGAVLSNEPKFKLFGCGSARVDSSWQGKAACSAVSRLYYVKSGSFYLVINGERINFNKGNWYLVPSGSSYEYGCDGQTEQLFFHFNLFGTEKIDLFSKYPFVLSLKDNGKKAKEIEGLLKKESEISTLNIKNTVMKILLNMIKEYHIEIVSSNYSPCVIKAINYIDKNLSENLTIKSVSKAIFVSESTLTKHIRKELGTTVNGYIDDLILTRAAQMISEGTTSISTISNRFGFCDQFYFSRKFKAKFGLTPSQYKKTRSI